MSTELVCFLVGIAATAIWLLAINRGVMPGGKWFVFVNSGWVYRSVNPGRFWFSAAILGFVSLGFVIMPVLSWLGVRG